MYVSSLLFCMFLNYIRSAMEENTSNSTMVTTEGYDSNGSSSYNHRLVCKNSRYDNSPSSLRFKGVVLQQNGHWGAQIYANHQRIWLGTFKSERAAAMAYDSAAIKLHSNDHHRNFPWTNITIQEPGFQELYTTDAVLNMIDPWFSASGSFIWTLKQESGQSHSLQQFGVSNSIGRMGLGPGQQLKILTNFIRKQILINLNRILISLKKEMKEGNY